MRYKSAFSAATMAMVVATSSVSQAEDLSLNASPATKEKMSPVKMSPVKECLNANSSLFTIMALMTSPKQQDMSRQNEFNFAGFSTDGLFYSAPLKTENGKLVSIGVNTRTKEASLKSWNAFKQACKENPDIRLHHKISSSLREVIDPVESLMVKATRRRVVGFSIFKSGKKCTNVYPAGWEVCKP